MNSCKEYVLDDLTAVVAIPVYNIDAADPASPVNRLTPTIRSDDFSPAYGYSIVIGRRITVAGDSIDLVPIVMHTGKAKDDESDSVTGRNHTVTVSCEVDDRDGAVWAPLLTLERSPRHLLLTFRDGTRAFVSATRDTYVCTVERSGAKTTVQFKVHNIMGIQLIV